MTKLEEKIIELGYVKDFEIHSKKVLIFFRKSKWNFASIQIVIDKNTNEIWKYQVDFEDKLITYYREFDDIEQAFNVMQKDLEELKKYDNQNNLE